MVFEGVFKRVEMNLNFESHNNYMIQGENKYRRFERYGNKIPQYKKKIQKKNYLARYRMSIFYQTIFVPIGKKYYRR